MFRPTLIAAPLSLILLSLGCDAGEPKTASADVPIVAGTKHEGTEAAAQEAPSRNEPTPAVEKPDPPVVDSDDKALADSGASPDVLGGPGEPMTFATEAVVKRSVELAAKVKKGRIPREALEGADSALAVLHLAQTAEDPQMAGAALKALSGLYWSSKQDKRRMVDADYVAVVVRRLGSDDPNILGGALAAADLAADVEPPDSTVAAALLGRAEPGQPSEVRVLALRGLVGVEPLTGDIQEAFLTALNDEDPGMVALTLSTMTHHASHFTHREPLIALLREMTSSEHAGVRGKALAALTNVDRSSAHREATTKLALEMLQDKHALVRGEAVYALGVMHQVQHADKVLAMMDDKAESNMRVDGWTKLDGSSANKLLVAPGGETVTATALLSLALLSSATDTKFEYVKLIDRKKIGQPDFAAAVVAAKAWVKAHGAAE